MYHDPPGTEIGGPNRWTLTADTGELPAEGGVVNLRGNVRAHGLMEGGNSLVTVASEACVTTPPRKNSAAMTKCK